MRSLDEFAAAKLAAMEARNLRRQLGVTARTSAIAVERNGRRLISFCCNDYLNLTHHPRVVAAAKDAIDRYGAGAGASRLITGNHPLLAALEARIARLKSAEDAAVFGSGYLANLGAIPTLVGPDDLILIDALSHACLFAGAKLSGATTLHYRHNDVAHLSALLGAHRAAHARALILTEGVFSMDGDLAPLPELASVAAAHDAWLMTDDAHGVGVVGEGRGSSFAFAAPVPVPLQMGTLSKAAGSYGGYLATSRPVLELMRNRARTFVYSTGLPPASAAAALAAIDIIETEPQLCARPVQNAALFCRELGLPAPASAIVPLILGDERRALAASRALEEDGFLVVAIRPPTVPEGTARLRFTFTAGHAETDIRRLAEAVRAKVLAPA